MESSEGRFLLLFPLDERFLPDEHAYQAFSAQIGHNKVP